jgi:hypothetical protein
MVRVSGRAIWYGAAVTIFVVAWLLLVNAMGHILDNPNDPSDTQGISMSSIAVSFLAAMGGLLFAVVALLWGASKLSLLQGKIACRVIRIFQGILVASLGAFGAVAAFEFGDDSFQRVASCLLFVFLIGLAFVPFRFIREC